MRYRWGSGVVGPLAGAKYGAAAALNNLAARCDTGAKTQFGRASAKIGLRRWRWAAGSGYLVGGDETGERQGSPQTPG